MSKIYLQTMGCSLNISDSEVMKGILLEAGHSFVENPEQADILIINSCTVKSNPEQRLFNMIRNREKPMIVAGCVPQADPDNKHFSKVSVIGPKALSKIADVVDDTLCGKTVRLLEEIDEERNTLPHVRSQEHIEIIPINAGCLSNCSYCKTKHARGGLQSYPVDKIEKQFRAAVNDAVKEIWLTSQDTGAYGLDRGTDIVELLKQLLKKPGDYRIRLGMANPQYIIPRIQGFIEVMQHPNMFRFLHLPVQSGSNKVLKDMKRGYTVEQFEKVVSEMVKAIPDITIATDIIVGFPTETIDDFNETADLIQRLNIPVVNISKFYPRPDTPAAKMKLLPTHIVKDRSTPLKMMCELVAKERNESFIGKELSVIIDEQGKHDTMVGRADNYIPVILKTGKIGERKNVLIKDSGTFDLRAFSKKKVNN